MRVSKDYTKVGLGGARPSTLVAAPLRGEICGQPDEKDLRGRPVFCAAPGARPEVQISPQPRSGLANSRCAHHGTRMARVLVVDDDNTIRHLIVMTLEGAGHVVISEQPSLVISSIVSFLQTPDDFQFLTPTN